MNYEFILSLQLIFVNIQIPELINNIYARVEIRNVVGEIIYNSNLAYAENKIKLNLTDPSGIYFVFLINDRNENIARGKFILQR
jgi:hypothetical protein